MVTMQEIRQQYPSPKPCPPQKGHKGWRSFLDDDYCVGGAVCRVADMRAQQHFPTRWYLGLALAALNPRLPTPTAERYATEIITANDQGTYTYAWEMVEMALTYTTSPHAGDTA